MGGMAGATTAWTTTVPSPIGDLHLACDGDGALTHALFHDETRLTIDDSVRRDAGPFVDATTQLAQYFGGEREHFDLPLAPAGTAFQLAAWTALRTIPYGTTRSYGEQARAAGHPNAIRAIGAANGRNPIGVIVPCHRVIGADGSLTGYGGGLHRKRWLLDHERRAVAPPLWAEP
jgi:methylated-DNA-[protein]-cysteine S-methyltransferase